MKQRVITAVIALLVLLTVLFVVPAGVAKAVFALVMLAGAWEWAAFLNSRRPALKYVYTAIIGGLLGAVSFMPEFDLRLLFVAVLPGWLAALVWTFFYPTTIPGAVRWGAGVFVLVPLYLALVAIYEAAPAVLLFALLIVWVADSGAFFAGKFLGRVRLAPKVSPKKTWEGVIGGLVAVVLLTLAYGVWADADLGVYIPFCLAVACISIVGDLTISMFKRDAGLKDSGTLFPGHGGVLDRIDSVAAAAPLFALGLGWLGFR
jgi:phosphatidate cytidylyltransferase